MKLYNVIAIFDFYVAAETPEKAREALLAWVVEGVQPSEVVAVEANRENTIRTAWRDQKPLVADDVSDEDFQKLVGKTTIQLFESIYTKRG